MKLTETQTEALKLLAENNPFRWKKQLRDFWERGLSDGSELQTTLYGLRNSHGPSWLTSYRISRLANRPNDGRGWRG